MQKDNILSIRSQEIDFLCLKTNLEMMKKKQAMNETVFVTVNLLYHNSTDMNCYSEYKNNT